eukprot:16113155-Heterocapsa_arctica.AAC.1
MGESLDESPENGESESVIDGTRRRTASAQAVQREQPRPGRAQRVQHNEISTHDDDLENNIGTQSGMVEVE